MTKILIPLDGSAAGARAIEQVLQRGAAGLELHLLNVQLPVDGNVRSFVSSDELNAYHRDEGLAELAVARALLDAAGVAYQQHVLVGHPADQISRFAAEQGFDEIVMGTHGRTGLLQLLMGSVAAEVSEQAKTRVTLVK